MTVELAGADGGYASESGIDITSDPLRAEEALAWFERRVPVRKTQWHALEDQARRRAFAVAGVTALDVLEDVWHEIDRAIANGTTFEDFRRSVGEHLAGEWSGSNPSRLETIFRTNLQSAYQAGRYQQMSDPEVIEDRPFWQYVAVLDNQTTKICKPLEGVTKRANDGFWSTHYPPLHYNCRSTVITLTEEQASKEPQVHGLGAPPLDGFGGKASLSEWQPTASDYPPQLWHAYEQWQARR